MQDVVVGAQAVTLEPELVLEVSERRLRGFNMPPLLTGELSLLSYLGRRPLKWHSSRRLAIEVYGREDAKGRQLVWKYASTLRQKLAAEADLIQTCRRRGYRCRIPIALWDDKEAA